MGEYHVVGKSVPRVDSIEKVTGRATYGADIRLPRMLYGRALRSPFAHARIVRIDISKAKKVPGVKAVITGEDLNYLGGEALKDYPFLAKGKVRYFGEPVAAVAAIDEEIVQEALDLIKVEYEPLPVVLDVTKAMEPDSATVHDDLINYKRIPLINPVKNSNICHRSEFAKGDIEKGFQESDHIYEDTFTTHMIQHGAIEPHMAIAQVDFGGRITVWVPNDGPHRLRKDLSDAMKIPMSRIRVITPDYLGGGFGSKGGLKVETICIALAMHTGGRPVKIVLTREETFTSSLVKHPSVVHIKSGVKNDGRIWARQIKLIYDTGAYAEKGPTVAHQGSAAAVGPYKIPHVKVNGFCVYTNKPIAGAYRGYGIAQIAWAHESQMDMIAHDLGIDPVQIRLINAVEEGEISPTGQQVLHSVGLKECIEKAAEAIEWDKKPTRKYRGKGIACGYKNTKTPSGSSAIIKIGQDGSIELLTSTVEIGQGAKTILAQIVAEEMGVPVDVISVSTPDTDLTPYDASTTSSRSTFHMGNAVKNAARDAKMQVFKIAAEALEANPDDLVIEDGYVHVKGSKDAKLSYPDVLRNQCRAGIDLIGRGSYHPEEEDVCAGPWSSPSIFWMYGAHCVELEVDGETGRVKILKYVGAHDVGKAINPSACEGQIEGGIVYGIGPTLFEELKIGENGEVLNINWLDYKVCRGPDIPEITSLLVEAEHKDGPFGAKGIGEMTTVPVAAAIANAIYDAVGVRFKDTPIRPEAILDAMKKNNKNK